MTPHRIVVLGASGFVGTTLTERLRQRPNAEVIPVIHSAGSAWRLARLGIPLMQVDVADRAALAAVIAGATHVVNCIRGPRPVMIDGLRNVLAACRAAGVRRFVHLSSVLVYGDPPPPESVREAAPAKPQPGPESYGAIKLEQDQMVQEAARRGLASVVLCPPNISGPFSGYIAGIAAAIRAGSFALVDRGEGPCNLVDIRNLCHAIERALEASGAHLDGRRIFVTDDGEPTWLHVVDGLKSIHGVQNAKKLPRATLEARLLRQSAKPHLSIRASLRHLVSSNVRAALRQDPLLAKLDQLARRAVAGLGRSVESSMRLGIEGPVRVAQPDPLSGLALGLCVQQLRGVRHSNELAKKLLGFSPTFTFERSMSDFVRWYRQMHGMDGAFWTLSQHLYE